MRLIKDKWELCSECRNRRDCLLSSRRALAFYVLSWLPSKRTFSTFANSASQPSRSCRRCGDFVSHSWVTCVREVGQRDGVAPTEPGEWKSPTRRRVCVSSPASATNYETSSPAQSRPHQPHCLHREPPFTECSIEVSDVFSVVPFSSFTNEAWSAPVQRNETPFCRGQN